MIKNNEKLVDNWILSYEEVSNNIYNIELADKSGRKVGAIGGDFENVIETCIEYAYDIEKQLGKSLNRFSYDTFKCLLTNENITSENYSEEDFGSWVIEIENRRVVLDGRDSLFYLQRKNKTNEWEDEFTIKLAVLSFDQIIKVRDKLIKAG